MKIKDLNKLMIFKHVIDNHEVNPLNLLMCDEFDRRDTGVDYRERAINAALKNRVDFSSEVNGLVNLTRRVIAVKCPHCKEEMKGDSAGGNQVQMTMKYECDKCKCALSLTLSYDAIFIGHKPPLG